jgi:hypothetical protein
MSSLEKKYYFGFLYKNKENETFFSLGFFQNKHKFNFIIGFENFFKKDLTQFFIKEKNSKKLKRIELENIRYCKVKLSNKQKIQISTNQVFLTPLYYKNLRENLENFNLEKLENQNETFDLLKKI